MSQTAKPAPAKRTALSSRTFTVTLSIPRAISLALVLSLSFLWFFILGVFLGRGYEPEQHFAELSEYLPQTSQQASQQANVTPPPLDVSPPDTAPHPSLISPDPSDPFAALYPAEAAAENGADQSARAVIDEADRAYRESLSTLQPAAPQAGTSGQAAAAKPAADTASPPVISAADQDTTVYSYVYQVASFKEEPQARVLADRLIKGGVLARVTKAGGSGGTTWHRVVIDHRGNPDSVTSLRERLKTFKIDKILLVSKDKT